MFFRDRMTARESLEHEWLKQLEGGLTATDIMQAQHASQIKPPDVVVIPLVDEDYPSSSESETPLEKSTELINNVNNDDSAFHDDEPTAALMTKEPEPELDSELESETKTELDPETEPKPETKPEPEPETEPETKPEAESETKPECKPEPEPEPVKVPEPEPESMPKPAVESKPVKLTEPEPQPTDPEPMKMKKSTKQSELEPAKEVEVKANPKSEPKVATKPARKSPPVAKKPEKNNVKEKEKTVEIIKKDKNDNIQITTAVDKQNTSLNSLPSEPKSKAEKEISDKTVERKHPKELQHPTALTHPPSFDQALHSLHRCARTRLRNLPRSSNVPRAKSLAIRRVVVRPLS